MARVTVEDCLELINNRFALCHLATKRSRQLMAGARPLVETPDNKEVVTSLREIAAGLVQNDSQVAAAAKKAETEE